MILSCATMALAFLQPTPQGLQVEQLESGMRYRIDEIPGASHVCVLFGIRTDDGSGSSAERGMADIYAAGMAASLHRAADRQAEVELRGTVLLALQTVPREALAEILAGIRGLLEGPLPLDADGFAIARARARLSADDSTQVYPGSILRDRARRLLVAGGPPGLTLPEEIHARGLVAFEDWQSRRLRAERSFVFLLGGVGSAEGEALIHAHFADLPAGSPAQAALAGDHASGPERPPLRSNHRRVLAPFVSLAVPVPPSGGEDYLAFAVGMGVLAQRAAFEFQTYRAGEAHAGFPFLDYSMTQQAGVALINRRGFDGDTSEQVITEIRGLVKPILEYGFKRDEVQRAARRLAAGLRIPPYSRASKDAMRGLWRILYTKALVLAAYEVWGWPRDLSSRLENVQVEDVNRVLREQMATESILWLSLEPSSRQ